MSRKVFVALFLSYFLCDSAGCDKIQVSLTALNNIINFYSTNAQYLNADGVFGLRICQGQLYQSRKLLNNLTNNLSQSLAHVEKAIDEVAAKVPIDSPYYLAFLPLLKKRVEFDFKYTPLNGTLNTLLAEGEIRNYDEDRGDHCYLDLMGTSKERDVKCYFTKSCLDYMLNECFHKPGYAATHALLYILIVEMSGCHLSFNILKNPKTTDWYKTQLCQKIHDEVHAYMEANSWSLDDRNRVDITMEQCVLCSVSGYAGFTSDQMLHEILTWQDPKLGCYSLLEKNTDGLKIEKRKDNLSPDGCGSHPSGLAAGYLASYIHHNLYTQNIE